MKYLILSISVLCLGVSGITGKSLSKVQSKKPLETVYKIKEDKDGSTLTIRRPQMEKPTLREITYYHIIERPYKKKGMNNEPSNEDQPTYEEIRRVFTNGPGFQYVRVKQTDPSNDDNKTSKEPVNDGTNQIDIRHGDIEVSNPAEGNIEFPKEITNNKDTEVPMTPKRRKRDIRYETSVAKREKRENNLLRFPDLPSTLYMNKQPAFTNVPNSMDSMALTPNKEENPSIRMNGLMRPYGMGFTGNNGNFWNNFNDPYHVFHNDDNQGFNLEADRTVQPIRFQPTPNTINSLPNPSDLGTQQINGSPNKNANTIGSQDQDQRQESKYPGHGKDNSESKKKINGSPKRGENLVGSKDLGHREGPRYPGYSKESGSEESDSRESRYESDESRESGSRSGEDSRGSGESRSGSDEDSGEDSAEHGYGKDSRESRERDDRKHKDASVKGSKDPNNVSPKGKSESYTDNSKETKKKFDQILSDLHNIFVKSNATVVIPSNNGNLVENKDAVNNAAGNDDTKKGNMISVLEGLFTNLIRNTIIVNNNVPVVQAPGYNPQNDASNPDLPQKFHDNVDTTTNSNDIKTGTDLNSFKDTTDKPSNKTGDLKPDEIKPEINGTDSKDLGRPDEVTTFNVTKLPNNTDTELNKNKTLPEEGNENKVTTSTEKPNDDKINKDENNDDDEKSNKTDEKTNKTEGDDPNKKGNTTETSVTGLKDTDCPSNNKDNKDSNGNSTKIDQMVDLMNNDKFWKFMGDLSAKYLESLVERTTKFMKDEIAAQIDKYFKEHKPEDNKVIQPKKDEVSNEKPETEDKKNDNVIENTNEGDTTENPIAKKNKDNSKKDKKNKKDSENVEETKKDDVKETRKNDIVHVKSHTIYGNTVGNDKVTNIYVFYASKNIDAIMKNIKDLVNDNNSTNIFNFETTHKHHKVKDEEKQSNGKHEGNDITGIPTDTVTDKNGDTVTEANTGDKVTVPTKETVTESNIEQPVTSKSNDTTESSTNTTPKEVSTRPGNVTTEASHSTTDISINSNKEEVSTESKNNITTTVSKVTEKSSNDVTTEAATTEKNSNNDKKNVTSKVEDKKTDENATTVANIDVTTEPSKDNEKTNGTIVSSNTTDVVTENPSNKTTTESPNNGTSTDKVETSTTKIDVSTIKPNDTENKAENATTHGNVTSNDVTTSNVTDASGPTTEGNKDKPVNSTENPSTESSNSNNKNETDVKEKPDTAKTGNDTKITPEKDTSLNKTSDNNEIDSKNNKTTESPTANNSTEKTAEKNDTTTDTKAGNNTNSIEKPETENKNVTLENNESEKKNGTDPSTEKNPDKSTDKQKDENSKMKSEDNKDSGEKDKKEGQTTENSLNKDTSTKKTDEATTVKNS